MMDTKDKITTEAPIQFTDSAMKEVMRLAAKEPGKTLRIGAKNGGCSGFSYIFEFDTPTAEDKLFQIGELAIAIDPMHLLHINNLSIDYQQGLNNRGFTFTNPNASETCGCGTSFG